MCVSLCACHCVCVTVCVSLCVWHCELLVLSITPLPSFGGQVLIAGSSGLVGTALSSALSRPSVSNNFHPEIYSLVRHTPRNPREVQWNPYEGRVDVGRLEGFDAIVNLAGERRCHFFQSSPPG